MILVHVDFEIGGPFVGIIQFASQVHDPYTNQVLDTFNEYVKHHSMYHQATGI